MAVLKPGQTTIAQIRKAIAERADQPTPTNSTYITINNYNDMIGTSHQELYDVLVTDYEDWFVASVPYDFTTNGTSSSYVLPDDLYLLLSVSQITVQGQANSAITLKPFNEQERNRYNVPYAPLFPGITYLRYKQSGSNPTYLEFVPVPALANQQIRVRYVPRLVLPQESGTILFNGVVAGNVITINGQDFTAVASAPAQGTADFLVGADDSATALSFAQVFNIWKAAQYGATPGALFNLASATVSTNVVTVTLTNPGEIEWSTTSNIAATPVFVFSPAASFSNIIDGVSGWEEYIVADVCIKIMAKEESDASVFIQQKERLLKRITAAAANRDVGSPQTVSNSTDNYGGGYGGGGSGWGGY